MGVRFRIVLVLLMAAVLLLAAGCNLQTVDVGDLQTKSESVEVGSAESVTADIAIGAGVLNVAGGGSALAVGVRYWTPTSPTTWTSGNP
jgi:hypothetical protein